MRYILVLLLMMILSGCTTTIPSITEYRISVQVPTYIQKSTSCKTKSLKVAQAFSPSSLMSHHMDYAQGDAKQYTYSQAQWSQSPNLAVSAQLLKHIRETQLFKTILNSKSRSKSDLILEINIEDFMQYYNDDETMSYVNVVIDLTLLDTKTGNVIETNTFSAKVDVKTLDAEGGVNALSSALGIVVEKSINWLGGVCK